MDLAVWWRGRRWAALLELIDQLPPTSRLNEAIYNDPEQAAALADRPASQEPWSPPLREWDLQAAMMRRLILAVDTTNALLAQSDRQPDPFPAPVTAVDRLERQRSLERQLDLIAVLTPGSVPSP